MASQLTGQPCIGCQISELRSGQKNEWWEVVCGNCEHISGKPFKDLLKKQNLNSCDKSLGA